MTGLGDARVARRYASALHAVAVRLNRHEIVRADLSALAVSARESSALRRVLESPLVPAPDKQALIDTRLTGLDEITRSLLRLLVRKGRMDALTAIHEEYERCADEAAGVARAFVQSAAPLSDTQNAELQAALSAKLGRPVLLNVRVEPEVLGGISVRIGDTVWDGSIRGALEDMREQMLEESARAQTTA